MEVNLISAPAGRSTSPPELQPHRAAVPAPSVTGLPAWTAAGGRTPGLRRHGAAWGRHQPGPKCPPLWEECTECNLVHGSAETPRLRRSGSSGRCANSARDRCGLLSTTRAGVQSWAAPDRRAACPADTRPRGSSPSEDEKVLQSWAIKAIS